MSYSVGWIYTTIDFLNRELLVNANRRFILKGLLLTSAALIAFPVFAESPADQDRKESLAALTKIAGSYKVKLDGKRAAKLNEEPVIRFSKPVSELQDAALFIWMCEGRPVAAGTFLWQRDIGLYHEFQSLALEPLQAERDGKMAWEPAEPGIKFAPIPDAPAPADTPNKRLVQMKALAEDFHSEATKGAPFYAENSVYRFRLLPRPLLRYSDPKRPELEGVIFAFVQDTDPEALLIVENRARGDKTGWEFAMAPMTGWPVKGWYKDREVWSIERRHPAPDPTKPYFVAGPFPIKAD